MRTAIFLLMSVALYLTFALSSVAASRNMKDSSKWLKDNHLELSAKEEPLVERANQVFDRVKAAADKMSGRPPELLVLKKSPGLYAAALPDGGIVLAKNALLACYTGVNKDKGDSRLAFILGHELAHLANNDFRHLDALSEIKGFLGDSFSIKSLLDLYPTNTRQIESAKKMQELDADGFGIVYMTMAGYDPRVVVHNNGTNFIREYIAQITGGKAYDDPSHPDMEQRVARIQSKLAAVADEVVLFQVGVHYFLHGDLDNADVYFSRFLEKFPSREVFNNIGLSHYQRALEHLSSCDKELPWRFILPVFLDSRTIADPERSRSGSQCQNEPKFKEEIEKSINFFEMARSHDPFYLSANLNLASAYIVAGNGLKAKSASRDALKIQPESQPAQMLEAISIYLDGKEDKIDMGKPALQKLESLLNNEHPNVSTVTYNMAMIEYELRRNDKYPKRFQNYLVYEPTGNYANMARLVLQMKPLKATSKIRKSSLKSPIPLGPLSKSALMRLESMSRKTITGGVRADIFQKTGEIIVVSNEAVELVIITQEGKVSVDAFIKQLGKPERRLNTPSGEMLIYEGLTAEIQEGVVKSMSFYGSD